jgi:hypothetical protein
VIRLQRKAGTFLPTLDQHHLLRASLLRDSAPVRESFERWKSLVHIDAIDQGSMRLLPLLYRNLKRLGSDDPLDNPMMPRLKGVYRQVWFRNQLILEHGHRALRTLSAAGIPAMVLKGAALVETVYEEPALRPMEDFDVLVPRQHFRRAVGLMLAGDWVFHPPLCDPEAHFVFQHAVGLRRDGGGELDLHWSAMGLPMDFSIADQDARTLAPADQLLQICTHATRFNPDIPPIRWAADAFLLLARAPFPWSELVERARARRLSLVMLRALEYLRDGLDAAIPEDVMATLARQVRIGERLALGLRNAGGRLVYVQFLVDWMQHAFVDTIGAPRRLLLLPRFLRSYCRVGSTAALLGLMTARLTLNRRRVFRESRPSP